MKTFAEDRPPPPPSPDQLPQAVRRQAALWTCDHARDTTDAKLLLDALGLLDFGLRRGAVEG